MSILTFFYTDYAGIDPAMVGLVFLISRCFDGFSDVIMGFIVERTNSKWGKSRPWILWTSVPFALSIVLIYTVPQGSSALQFAYLFVTYRLLYGTYPAIWITVCDDDAHLERARHAFHHAYDAFATRQDSLGIGYVAARQDVR